jgi:hypothetical protein
MAPIITAYVTSGTVAAPLRQRSTRRAVSTAQATAPPLDTVAVFADVIPEFSALASVPVVVPDRLPSTSLPAMSSRPESLARVATTSRVAGAPGCNTATACTFGSLTARRGMKLGGRPNVTLKKGIRGLFRPLACGACCGAPSIAWKQGGVRYEILLKAVPGTRRQFICLANSAIAAGPR